ncbi:MAG: energy transducer TonB [Desulfomonilaceae bacterium]
MISFLTYSENLTSDFCVEAQPPEGLGLGISDIGLRLEPEFPVGDDEEFSDWSSSITNIDVDLVTREDYSDTTIRSYLSSDLDKLRNVEGQIELDLPPQDLLSEIADEWPSCSRTNAVKSPGFAAGCASALVHLCLFLLFAFVPETQVAGAAGHAGNVLSVRITSPEELVPQDESPASIDSAASMPSIAGKVKKPRELHASRTAQPPQEMRELGPRPEKILLHEKQTEDKREDKTDQRKEQPRKIEDSEGDGPMNSIASLPSVASVERRFIAAAGAEGKAFESMVLSAIREVIFFPKKAANERHHGEVIAAFTINRDGSVSNLSVTKTSGFPLLDEAALKIIQNAAKKFPPIPDSLNKESVDYVVPIMFKEHRE